MNRHGTCIVSILLIKVYKVFTKSENDIALVSTADDVWGLGQDELHLFLHAYYRWSWMNG